MKTEIPASTLLAPVPAVMVSCGDMHTSDIVTIAWAGTVNSDPPMLSISVRRSRYSYGLIKATGEFVVNLVDAALLHTLDGCGVVSGRDVDKFEKFHLTRQKCSHVSAPAVAECPVSLECVVRETVELPSHVMFIAEIVGGVAEGGAVTARTAVLVGHARKGSAQQRADAVRIQSAPHVRKGTVIHAERAPVPAAFGRKREFRAVHRAAPAPRPHRTLRTRTAHRAAPACKTGQRASLLIKAKLHCFFCCKNQIKNS